MWNPIYLEAENIVSHKSIVYNFISNELTAIYGINLDKSKKKSNGSGKSVILDAIALAITGDVLRPINTIKEMINNDEDSCYSLIVLENKRLKKTLQIKRIISRKSSQKIEIEVNKQPQDQLKDLHPKESNKFIEESLGISFDDLLNYYLISKFKYQSLFLATDSVKKEVINRFSKADSIDKVFPLLKNDRQEAEKRRFEKKQLITATNTTIKVYEEQINDLIDEDSKEAKLARAKEIEDLIEATQIQITQYNKSIANLNEQIVFIEKDLKSQQQTKKYLEEKASQQKDDLLIKLNSELSIKKDEYSKIRDNYKNGFELLDAEETESKRLIKEYEEEIREYHKFILELEAFIAGEIECPKCHHKFILANDKFDLETAKQQVIEFNGYQKEAADKMQDIFNFGNRIKADRQDLENKIKADQQTNIFDSDKLKKQIDSIEKEKNELNNEISKINKEILMFNHDIEKSKLSINNFNHQIKLKNDEIKDYKLKVIEAKKDKHKDAIKNLNTKIEALTIKLNEQESELEIIEFEISKIEEWEAKFKKFKSYLANQSISQIQGQANYFLDKMKADMFVFIDGYRELSNKKLKEEITVELSRDGLTGESFGKFSGGEKSTADLASILAMQNIINLTSITGGMDFLGIDEILESIDSDGMDDVVNCLNNLNQTIMLIAHSQPNMNIDCNRLIVQKVNKISSIQDVE